MGFRMADVLLTHSYHLFYDSKQVRKMQPYPPLGTLYAAALLRQHGFSVALFDAMLEDPERGFPAALARHRPQIVAIYEDNFNFLSKMCLTRMREVAFGMLDSARATGTTVVVNGSDASDHVERYLQRGFHFVLSGEAEWTLLGLVRALAQAQHDVQQLRLAGGAAETIPGLAFWRRDSGEVIRTSSRPLMRNLDELPFPARDLVDIGRYHHTWKSAHGFFSLNAVASRGCPFRCNWCAKPIYGNSFHARSAASVAEEMRQLKEDFGAEHVWFADDIFALKPQWSLELADEVERRRSALPFKMQSRVDLMTPEVVGALRRAGCAEVWMGVESGSQRILDAMEKGTYLAEIPAARENLRRHAVRACFFLQFGYPGETWEDIQETIRLVRQTRPDDIGVSVAYPLPGTKFHARVREQLGEKTNWVDSDDLAVIFKGAYTNEFYWALRDALHAEVETWSQVKSGGNGMSHVRVPLAGKDSPGVAHLWELVDRLEKTCRNVEPTLSSCGGARCAEA
jgi:anaerobic magnesium-protoporphyrin IX monomethyl ester cyclase